MSCTGLSARRWAVNVLVWRGLALVVVAVLVVGCGRDRDGLTGPGALVPNASVSDAAGGITPPGPPVVFLHYDYMAAPTWDPSQGNFAPDPAAIQRVVDAFRARGITLVIDPQHSEIPYHQVLFLAPRGFRLVTRFGRQCGPPVCINFYELRDQYFQPRGSQAWHYVIFGHQGWSQYEDSPVGGMAELPGYNFYVTVPFPRRTCFVGTTLDLCRERVPGAFMHELGHNLGLHHGGDEAANNKLNYVSVMNYSFQGGISSIAPGDTAAFRSWVGSPPEALAEYQRIVAVRVDYSGEVLPTLDELHLDERVGVGGPASSTDVTFYLSCTLPRPCINGVARIAAGPLDWDNDGVIAADVTADINAWDFYFNFNLYFTRQTGFNDWAHVQQFLRTPQYVAGTLRPVQLIADPVEPGNSGPPVR